MIEKEYECLRNELNENRKYVFERPLIIFSAACVFFNYVSKTDYLMLFPCFVILLLLFNLHFTSNRLNSSARIIAYIRLHIEQKHPDQYQWETFLEFYRKKSEKPGLRYYPVIFNFHIGMILLLLFLDLLIFFDGHPLTFQFCYSKAEIIPFFSAMIILFSFVYFISIRKEIFPKYVKNYFEKETQKVAEIIALMENKVDN